MILQIQNGLDPILQASEILNSGNFHLLLTVSVIKRGNLWNIKDPIRGKYWINNSNSLIKEDLQMIIDFKLIINEWQIDKIINFLL